MPNAYYVPFPSMNRNEHDAIKELCIRRIFWYAGRIFVAFRCDYRGGYLINKKKMGTRTKQYLTKQGGRG